MSNPSFTIGDTLARMFRASQNGAPLDMTGWGVTLFVGVATGEIIGGTAQSVTPLVSVPIVWTQQALGEGVFSVSPTVTATWDAGPPLVLAIRTINPAGVQTTVRAPLVPTLEPVD